MCKTSTKSVDTKAAHIAKNYAVPEDGQELRPKHVGAVINKLKNCATSSY
jgi:hypothetical protein